MSSAQSKYPLIGAHMSIAGGVYRAISYGRKAKCSCIQIFTKSNNQWKAKPLTDREINRYFMEKEESGIDPIIAHTAYLINIASPKPEVYQKSVEALIIEIERCAQLEIMDLVLHPGSFLDTSEEIGIQKIVDTLNMIFKKTKDIKTRIALETTAGQGTNLGHTFEQLAQMIAGIKNKSRISVCLDTCHIFAAGYDIRDKQSYTETFNKFDKIIGLKYLKAIHLNDSKKELSSKRDRHTHLGVGEIGPKAFGLIMQDKRLKNIPKILETPKDEDGVNMDEVNLNLLRKFYKA